MNAPKGSIELETSIEVLNLQDAGFNEQVNKILTKSAKKKAKRKASKERRVRMEGQPKKGKNRECNIEHLCPKSRNGSNHAINFKESLKTAHAGKHAYLGVQLPHEQIGTILEDNFQVLCEETRDMIKEEIEAILEYYIKWEEFYNKKAFKGDIHPKLS